MARIEFNYGGNIKASQQASDVTRNEFNINVDIAAGFQPPRVCVLIVGRGFGMCSIHLYSVISRLSLRNFYVVALPGAPPIILSFTYSSDGSARHLVH